jgi:uncharacterized protein YodC (DUF2158 family)
MADEEQKPPLPQEGDLVSLRSGGPKMTIAKILPSGTALCDWFETTKDKTGNDVAQKRHDAFRLKTLQPAN